MPVGAVHIQRNEAAVSGPAPFVGVLMAVAAAIRKDVREKIEPPQAEAPEPEKPYSFKRGRNHDRRQTWKR
jgi:hypothetical protein